MCIRDSLGAEDIPGFFPLKFPGPDSQARWMSKAVYYPKIMACSELFLLTEEEKREVTLATEFVTLFYARPWFETALASSAAWSDVTFMTRMLAWYRLEHPNIALNMLQNCYGQLWYLTGETIVFALLDEGMEVEQRELLAKTLHATPQTELTIAIVSSVQYHFIMCTFYTFCPLLPVII